MMNQTLSNLKKVSPSIALTALVAMPVASAHEDLTKPEIKVEKKKDGLYMYIDGVKVHETDTTKQPLPKVVTSGAAVGAPPSDAVVLFDGSEKSFKENWSDTKGGASKWKTVDGAMESVRGAGYIQSKAKFGSCQLHIEWASPAQVNHRWRLTPCTPRGSAATWNRSPLMRASSYR